MRALEFIRDHVTFKLPYDFSYQMKTSKDPYKNLEMRIYRFFDVGKNRIEQLRIIQNMYLHKSYLVYEGQFMYLAQINLVYVVDACQKKKH